MHLSSGGVLAVASALPRPEADGRPYYVVELFKTVDYVGTADGVVRSAFL